MITETSCMILLKLKFAAIWISLWIFLLTSVLMALVHIWLWLQHCFPVSLCLKALKAIFQGKAWKAHLIKTPLRFFWKSPLNLALGNWAKLGSLLLATFWIGTFPGIPPHLDWVFPESDPGSRFCHECILWANAAKLPMWHFTCMTFLQGSRTWSSNTVLDHSHHLIQNNWITPICFSWSWIHFAESKQIIWNEHLPDSLSCTLPPSSVHPHLPTYCCREVTQR